LAIPAISETSGVNCMQNFKTLKPVAVQMICFLKQNGLIEIYYLKFLKTRPIKQIVVFLAATRVEKTNQKHVSIYFRVLA
jgi:hypothetical protein